MLQVATLRTSSKLRLLTSPADRGLPDTALVKKAAQQGSRRHARTLNVTRGNGGPAPPTWLTGDSEVRERGACELSTSCVTAMIGLYRSVCHPGGLVCSSEQCEHVKQLPGYAPFLYMVRKLPYCDPSSFSNSGKLTFWLNVYNVLTMHAVCSSQL